MVQIKSDPVQLRQYEIMFIKNSGFLSNKLVLTLRYRSINCRVEYLNNRISWWCTHGLPKAPLQNTLAFKSCKLISSGLILIFKLESWHLNKYISHLKFNLVVMHPVATGSRDYKLEKFEFYKRGLAILTRINHNAFKYYDLKLENARIWKTSIIVIPFKWICF